MSKDFQSHRIIDGLSDFNCIFVVFFKYLSSIKFLFHVQILEHYQVVKFLPDL